MCGGPAGAPSRPPRPRTCLAPRARELASRAGGAPGLLAPLSRWCVRLPRPVLREAPCLRRERKPGSGGSLCSPRPSACGRSCLGALVSQEAQKRKCDAPEKGVESLFIGQNALRRCQVLKTTVAPAGRDAGLLGKFLTDC